jgi:hypothetical protein
MTRHLITAAILLAAVAMYALGMSGGGFALLLAGGAFELWFWIRAFRVGEPDGQAKSVPKR